MLGLCMLFLFASIAAHNLDCYASGRSPCQIATTTSPMTDDAAEFLGSDRRFLTHIPNSRPKRTEMETGLPLYQAPPDVMRNGFSSLQTDAKAPHPVAVLQESSRASEWRLKLDAVRRTHGAHMAMRLATERAIHSQPLRLPGLPSSRVAFDTITGDDTMVDFSDYLNDPQLRPEEPKIEIHEAMEIKLGLIL